MALNDKFDPVCTMLLQTRREKMKQEVYSIIVLYLTVDLLHKGLYRTDKGDKACLKRR